MGRIGRGGGVWRVELEIEIKFRKTRSRKKKSVFGLLSIMFENWKS